MSSFGEPFRIPLKYAIGDNIRLVMPVQVFHFQTSQPLNKEWIPSISSYLTLGSPNIIWILCPPKSPWPSIKLSSTAPPSSLPPQNPNTRIRYWTRLQKRNPISRMTMKDSRRQSRFKRDANLRMHMRALGNQYKTPEALAKKPENGSEVKKSGRKTRFSCPYGGCNRSKKHDKFRPFKSVICVSNHFKRNHCPKRYGCNKCHKKKISVLADLKSHLKHCAGSSGGEESKKWKCSCGNSFCRKDKLFRHLSLFEGHMPAVAVEEEEDDGFHARS
ncbi:hypothetical protein Goshw_008335, partial [Gossypium schwendimanii]|nr:hypothetical protein [Gossypium schwendimanii]